MQNAKIIDADGHVQDRDAEIRKFMEEPYCRRRGPLVAKDKWDSSMYGKLNRDIHDVPTRLGDMDREGIDISVLFPTSAFGITQSPEKDYAAAFLPRLNDWIASALTAEPVSKESALVPFQDVAMPRGPKETTARHRRTRHSPASPSATFGMKERLGQHDVFGRSTSNWKSSMLPLLVHNSRQGPAGENPLRYLLFPPYHWTAV